MTPDKIRQIVREEISRSNASSRFRYDSVPHHTHNGTDSLQIKGENIIPSISVAGSITFQQATTYTIKLNSNFTPTNILAYGIVVDGLTAGTTTRRCHVMGSAQLTPSFYLQPETTTTVVTGNKPYPFPTVQPDGSSPSVPVQGSSYISVTDAGVVKALTSQFHIVDVEDSSIHARVTVIGYSKDAIILSVPYLDTNWRIIMNYVIT